MLRLRHGHPSIARGSFEHSQADGLVAGWQRRLDRDHTAVLIDYGVPSAETQVRHLPRGAVLQALWPAAAGTTAAADKEGSITVTLPGQTLRV
ncbi:MAG: hypothetical protein JNM33_08195 [Rubrivivax sp.]|nr:hypothetical protein [Rubrivivax sp.]